MMSWLLRKDRVTAHKYLAFIYCVSDKKKQCREQFKEAMEIDSDFELSPSEAGHPIWGPHIPGSAGRTEPP